MRKAAKTACYHRDVPQSGFLRIGLVSVAIVMLAIAVMTSRFSILPIAIAMACLTVAATSLSHAGRLSEPLNAFRNRPVDIRIWGEPLPNIGHASCRIESIRALGAGLHFFIRCGADSPRHLKIAQPRSARIGETGVEIGEAKYVQWDGMKLPRAEAPAVTVFVL